MDTGQSKIQGRYPPHLPRAILIVEVAPWTGRMDSGGEAPMTVGFPQGQSAYELDPSDRLDYVERGFKRFSQD
jgi:hypothetical protein